MSIIDDRLDRDPRRSACSCGRHLNHYEHERDVLRELQCQPVEVESKDTKYRSVIVSAAMRAMFSKGAA